MLLAWGTERDREGLHVCAVSQASLVPAVCIPAGAGLAVCARSFTESCNSQHLASSLPKSLGMEALEPAGKSCGSFGAAWEVLWLK